MTLRQHHQTHAHRAVRTSSLQFGGTKKLGMDFVAVDRFETTFGEIRLGRGRQQIELTDATGSEAIELRLAVGLEERETPKRD